MIPFGSRREHPSSGAGLRRPWWQTAFAEPNRPATGAAVRAAYGVSLDATKQTPTLTAARRGCYTPP